MRPERVLLLRSGRHLQLAIDSLRARSVCLRTKRGNDVVVTLLYLDYEEAQRIPFLAVEELPNRSEARPLSISPASLRSNGDDARNVLSEIPSSPLRPVSP